MLSEPDIETAVSDAVYRISWHVNPFNERDQSFLRTVIDETPNQELHGFLERLASTELGKRRIRSGRTGARPASAPGRRAPTPAPTTSRPAATSQASRRSARSIRSSRPAA